MNRPSARILPGGARWVVIALLTLALTVCGLGGVAGADVPDRSVGHVYVNLNNSPGNSSQSSYMGFLSSLRNAAGHQFAYGVQATQSNTGGLIRADVTVKGHTVWLWLSPNNLYVRGFTNQYGITYQFADSDYDLRAVMGGITSGNNLLPPLTAPGGGSSPGPLRRLYFRSDYNSMDRAAGRGREEMQISYNDLIGSVANLATTGDPTGGNQQAVARSLMFMIQYTAEAARFSTVQETMSTVMLSNRDFQSLPERAQYLENNWAHMSQYLRDAANGSHPQPITVAPGVTLNNTGDVAYYLRMMIGSPNQVNSNGDWDHTEL